MIVGIGIDVVDIERFGETLERSPRLGERLFTPAERQLPLNSRAARFAAKEAFAKALGAPVGLVWTDVTVHRVEGGAPVLEYVGTVADRVAALGISTVHVSLSHDAGVASAVVVCERLEGVSAP
ncbi:MAG: holo-ACP synthase [Intrasporangiaceae bacterium]|nr:holo-ACP synthase [Intrasporangiaceae bacterium]